MSDMRTILKTTKEKALLLEKIGIKNITDMLQYFPRSYNKDAGIRKISEINPEAENTIIAKIIDIQSKSTRVGVVITGIIEDETGDIEVVWFNQGWLVNQLKIGDKKIFRGKVKSDIGKYVLRNPKLIDDIDSEIAKSSILPIYPLTEGIMQEWMREKMTIAMQYIDRIQEYIPDNLLAEYKLIPLPQAIKQAHYPKNEQELEQAQKRLSFGEVLMLQIIAMERKAAFHAIHKDDNSGIDYNQKEIDDFLAAQPFTLTNAQKKCVNEILEDLKAHKPMARMLQGDVGSGKTIVAATAMLATINAGKQVAFMSPTEILAKQHYKSIVKIFPEKKIELLIGSQTAKEKKEKKDRLRVGDIDMLVGTHALIQDTVVWKDLSLAVIDEQHRFGVEQRKQLSIICKNYLMMTATPIPRSLALAMYGEMEVSTIDEMPKGRIDIKTYLVPESKKDGFYDFVEKELEKGNQVFFVYPMIDESEHYTEVKVATEQFDVLKEIFPKYKIGLLHGKMSTKEKDEHMEHFANREFDILVATTVIEVGIDIPNATIMAIESAERFGLSQLHQLRGRVGRSDKESFCFLFASTKEMQNIKRLKLMTQESNGFKLAEHDLELRGSGEIFGTEQSGFHAQFGYANLLDGRIIEQAKKMAEEILENHKEVLESDVVKKKILSYESG